MSETKPINVFEKYLALWVALCMALGILLSIFFPVISQTIDSWQIHGISIPIGICLFLMMYPAMLNIQFSEIKTYHDFELDCRTANRCMAGNPFP